MKLKKDEVYYVEKTGYKVKFGILEKKIISGGKVFLKIRGDNRYYPQGMVSKNLNKMMELSNKLQYEAL